MGEKRLALWGRALKYGAVISLVILLLTYICLLASNYLPEPFPFWAAEATLLQTVNKTIGESRFLTVSLVLLLACTVILITQFLVSAKTLDWLSRNPGTTAFPGAPAFLLTEKELLEKESKRTAAILNSIADAVVTFDALGQIKTFSPAAERLFECTAGEVLGQRFATLVAPPSQELYEGYIAVYLESDDREDGDIGIGCEIQALRKTGKTFPAALTVSKAFAGDEYLGIGVFRDITVRKEAEEEIKKAHSLVELMRSVAVAANEAATLETALHAGLEKICQYLGWNMGHCYLFNEHNGRLCSSRVWYFAAEENKAFKEASEHLAFLPGEGWVGKTYQDCQPQWIENPPSNPLFIRKKEVAAQGLMTACFFPIIIGKKAVGVIECFSLEKHKVDPHILKVMGNICAQLGRVVERHQAEELLKTAKRTAESANQAKSDFLANMSHEVRTPLNGIVGGYSLLNETELNAEQKRYLAMQRRSTEALLDIMNDILDISKIEAGILTLNLAPFNLQSIIEDIGLFMTASAHEKNIELHCHYPSILPSHFIGDAARVRQILGHLVSNAIKFTDNGQVLVEASDNEGVSICIKDTGMGIAPEDQERIFGKFTQADTSDTRKFGGAGLGLTISRQLVKMMGGHIRVESVLGKGSCFTIHLPLPVDTAIHEEKRGNDEKTQKILLVEDIPLNQEISVMLLKKMGYRHIDLARNGKEAVTMVKNKDYHAILMDCQMPEMDGFEATQRIREYEKKSGNRTPIIAVTADVFKANKEKCLEAGMDDYLNKPLILEHLNDALNKWLVDV